MSNTNNDALLFMLRGKIEPILARMERSCQEKEAALADEVGQDLNGLIDSAIALVKKLDKQTDGWLMKVLMREFAIGMVKSWLPKGESDAPNE